MIDYKREHGFFSITILVVIVLCALAGYYLGLTSQYVPVDKPVVPFFLMATLLAPVGFSIQLILKLADVKKIKGVNRDEKRRLDSIVDTKIFQLVILLAFSLLATTTVGVLFYLAALPQNPKVPSVDFLIWSLRATGALLLFSIFATIYSVLETRKIISFEAKIIARAAERKAKAAILKKMQPVSK